MACPLPRAAYTLPPGIRVYQRPDLLAACPELSPTAVASKWLLNYDLLRQALHFRAKID